ncbi:MAG: hypothetical protein QXQ40_01830 [Candidatus Aenigmatarchaeota archaeon]
MQVEEMIWEFFRVPSIMRSGIFINDLVNLILLPSIVLLIFLSAAASAFLPADMRVRWKGLVALVLYMVIITQGFYAPFAAFAANYMILFLILAFGMFAITRFIPMKYWKAGTKIATKYGEKSQDIKRIQGELKVMRRERARLERNLARATAPEERHFWMIRIEEIQRDIDRLELRLKEIRKMP